MDFDALTRERNDLLARANELPIDNAWTQLVNAIKDSVDHNGHPIVYDGPPRSYLNPLAFDLMREFKKRGKAIEFLFKHADDENPLIAGYCISALDDIDDQLFKKAATKLINRNENIKFVGGCFAFSGSLGAHVHRMLQDLEELEQLEEADNQ